jgi:hypothetical protein
VTGTARVQGRVRAAPVRVREVLRPVRRGSADVGAVVLDGSRWAGRARAAATGTLIGARAVQAVDAELVTLLVGELERYTALREAARRSRLDPDTPVYVELAQLHTIPVVTTADLDVLLDRLPRAGVTVVLEVEFGLFGMRAVVQDGWLTHLDGRHSVSACLKVDSVEVSGGPAVLLDCTLAETRRATERVAYSLPGPVPLPDPGERGGPTAGWA